MTARADQDPLSTPEVAEATEQIGKFLRAHCERQSSHAS